MSKYRVSVGNKWVMFLTHRQMSDLRDCIEQHGTNGYRDGWSRSGCVNIDEVSDTSSEPLGVTKEKK